MRTLTIGFSTNASEYNVLSAAIRCVQRTPYSHVYVKVHSNYWDKDIIYQSSGTAVNMMTEPIFLRHSKIIKEYEIQVEDDVYKAVVGYAISQCGIKYGLLQLLGILAVEAVSLVGKNIENPWGSGYICSELVAQMLKRMGDVFQMDGYLAGNNLTYNNITPKHIDKIMSRFYRPVLEIE